MRLRSLTIENFRAIRSFSIDQLTDFVLIAGPNGCGKSCVLDAIRLIKSVYGGYQANEWQQWFGEFQINLNNRDELLPLMRDPTLPMIVSAEIELHQSEKDYLGSEAERILEPLVWREVTGHSREAYMMDPIAVATQHRQHARRVRDEIADRAAQVRESLSREAFSISVRISQASGVEIDSSPTIELIFQTYEPSQLGIIDYHSASRTYQREALGGVDLNIQSADAKRRSQTLYNWREKYQNVKSELATMYFRDLIMKEAGANNRAESDLNEVMKELFQIFFPDKQYLGVQPNVSGSLSFPVRLKTGETHDINELSSGEKEVVYGYLRLRSSSARHSVLLLDEPELHLNPGLLQGFSDFYHRHLGRARGNQLWLVTHSDTLLRQAVGNTNYSVYHMMSATTIEAEGNQASRVVADNELEAATIDLVGDLAVYQPRRKVVIFEGGGDTGFDVTMTGRLFPEFARLVNLVSGGKKQRVRDLYEVLADTAEQVGMAKRFYAVVDKDTDPQRPPATEARTLSWDAYHIENYLLEPQYVRAATAALSGSDRFSSDEEVMDVLRNCALTIMSGLRIELLRKHVNGLVVGALKFGADPSSVEPVNALLPSIQGSFERVDGIREFVTDPTKLREIDLQNKQQLDRALASGAWVQEFPGRKILQQYTDVELKGLSSYEAFRNLLIDRMVDGNFQPSGMKRVIDSILEESM